MTTNLLFNYNLLSVNNIHSVSSSAHHQPGCWGNWYKMAVTWPTSSQTNGQWELSSEWMKQIRRLTTSANSCCMSELGLSWTSENVIKLPCIGIICQSPCGILATVAASIFSLSPPLLSTAEDVGTKNDWMLWCPLDELCIAFWHYNVFHSCPL